MESNRTNVTYVKDLKIVLKFLLASLSLFSLSSNWQRGDVGGLLKAIFMVQLRRYQVVFQNLIRWKLFDFEFLQILILDQILT